VNNELVMFPGDTLDNDQRRSYNVGPIHSLFTILVQQHWQREWDTSPNPRRHAVHSSGHRIFMFPDRPTVGQYFPAEERHSRQAAWRYTVAAGLARLGVRRNSVDAIIWHPSDGLLARCSCNSRSIS